MVCKGTLDAEGHHLAHRGQRVVEYLQRMAEEHVLHEPNSLGRVVREGVEAVGGAIRVGCTGLHLIKCGQICSSVIECGQACSSVRTVAS